jgi:hypothetical protein
MGGAGLKKFGWVFIPLVLILLSGCFSPRPSATLNTEFDEAYGEFRARFVETMQNIQYEMDENDKPILKRADIEALRRNLAVLSSFADSMIEKADTSQEKLCAQLAVNDCLNINTLSYLEEERRSLPEYNTEKASDVIEALLRSKELYSKTDK